eukprot:1148766-Pelagomonas_calceolata.AAC.8
MPPTLDKLAHAVPAGLVDLLQQVHLRQHAAVGGAVDLLDVAADRLSHDGGQALFTQLPQDHHLPSAPGGA